MIATAAAAKEQQAKVKVTDWTTQFESQLQASEKAHDFNKAIGLHKRRLVMSRTTLELALELQHTQIYTRTIIIFVLIWTSGLHLKWFELV